MMNKIVLLSLAILVPAFAVSAQSSQNEQDQSPLKNVVTYAPPAAPAQPPKSSDPSDFPTWEMSLGYQFNGYRVFTPSDFHTSGFNVSFTRFLNNWFGLEGNLGFGFGHTGAQTIPNNLSVKTLFVGAGPHLAYRSTSRLEPWGHGLVGLEHMRFTQTATFGTESTVGWMVGGGLDIHMNDLAALRFEGDYLGTQFFSASHRNYQFVAGVVFSFGGGGGNAAPPPAPVARNPFADCSADKASVFAGTGDVAVITAQGSDPGGSPLEYSWMATGGSVNGTGPQVRWQSAGLGPGTYTISATVTNNRGGSAVCSVNEAVTARPNRPPTVSLSSDRDTVFVGEKVTFTATGSDPDGDQLTYTWRANCGTLTAVSNTVNTLDTTGVAPGTCTVTVRADDGRGGAADASKAVTIQAPPPPPQSSKLNSCAFASVASSRVDNVCKRILDDVALRLQNDPRATVVIVGYANPGAQANKTAGDRAANTVTYLTGKGIDKARLMTRTGAGQAGAGKDNNRIDIIWVPQGATF